VEQVLFTRKDAPDAVGFKFRVGNGIHSRVEDWF
jgi:hypothetical protein